MNAKFRKNRMSNVRIQQIVTLFYMHKIMVESDGIRKHEGNELKKVLQRMDKNYNYYDTNFMIRGTLDFLKLVIDSWFIIG